VDRVLGEAGIPKDSPAGRREFERQMEARRQAEAPESYRDIRRGWCWGGAAFRQELLAQMGEKVGASHYGAERAESQADQAERLVREELRRRGWAEAQLQSRKKGDWEKIQMAQRLRRETPMTLGWIAHRLRMGSVAYLNNRLYLLRAGKLQK
jgi:hypothetical protein